MIIRNNELIAYELVKRFGFKQSSRGFRYLVKAVALCLDSEDYLNVFTKRLYSEVQNIHKATSLNAVERNIRHLIEEGFYRGVDKALQVEVFGYDLGEDRPTNKEFVSAAVTYIKLNSLKHTNVS